jgi:NTP pyrophosphatase (non-canonical NTP hydrolase)
MSEIKALTDLIVKFRDERDWAQFHNSKDLALSLSVEASELLELFLWKDADEADRDKLKDEVGDVFYNLLLLCHTLDIDPEIALRDKLKLIEKKYPAEKSKGSNKKYDELN